MLTLRPASIEWMPFRQSLLNDPRTMAYNARWTPPDGCIAFPEMEWDAWLEVQKSNFPECGCFYLIREDGTPVGEASWHGYGVGMGIVIHADYRGKGYGREGLHLLVDEAFRHKEITELMNSFEESRHDALTIHKQEGFVVLRQEKGMVHLRLTRERYAALRRRGLLAKLMDAMCAFDAGDALRIHHFVKVHNFARQIGIAEGMDDHSLFVLEAAAITHDIGIHPSEAKYGDCIGKHQEELGPIEAEPMLRSLGFEEKVVQRVCFLIGHHHTTVNVEGMDWQILLEADFLVNMVEGNMSAHAIDTAEEKLFRTVEGKRLLRSIVPGE